MQTLHLKTTTPLFEELIKQLEVFYFFLGNYEPPFVW